MEKILHKISPSEIKYGRLYLTKSDGTKEFFNEYSESFTLITKGQRLYSRTVGANKIWIGYETMRKFNVGEVIEIIKKNDNVYIESRLFRSDKQ